MKCKKCGAENPEEAEYCQKCGEPLKKKKRNGLLILFGLLAGLFLALAALLAALLWQHKDCIFSEKPESEVVEEVASAPVAKVERSGCDPVLSIVNEDLNILYGGVSNKLKISVSGVADDKVKVDCSGATLTKDGDYYMCKPTGKADVKLSVSAEIDGNVVPVGEQTFRVKTLPDPTPFLCYKDDNGKNVYFNPNIEGYQQKPTRKQLYASTLVARYTDGVVNANFKIGSFAMVFCVRGGNVSKPAKSNSFSDEQLSLLKSMKTGEEVFFKEIECNGDKHAMLTFPTIKLP